MKKKITTRKGEGITASIKVVDENRNKLIDVTGPLNKALPEANKLIEEKFGIKKHGRKPKQ